MARRPDPERLYEAHRAGHLSRLIAESRLSPEAAEGWMPVRGRRSSPWPGQALRGLLATVLGVDRQERSARLATRTTLS
jgi:hypothetical protein